MDLFSQSDDHQHVYSVSEITRDIKTTLESAFPPLWVQGELSNFIHHRSGHMYFTLKDASAQLSGVMWKGRNALLRFSPQEGMKVVVLGSIRVYERRGQYQVDCVRMMPAGIGELQMAFEQLKSRLKEEGLFDPEHKRSIPEFPDTIGVITSASGAAIRDIVNVINRRFPGVRLVIRPTLVQGDDAAADIEQAIKEMNDWGQADVLIVGRGGGSLEDLWPFNEERVARALYDSRIPVISAVGHEIDFTIADFVADLRAPTPSAAAEMAVPNREDLYERLTSIRQRLNRQLTTRLHMASEQLNSLRNRYSFRRPLDRIRQERQRLDDLSVRMSRSLTVHLERNRQRVESAQQRLAALNPGSVLKRGYCICLDEQEKSLSAVDMLNPDQTVTIQFYRGAVGAQISHIDSNQRWDQRFLSDNPHNEE
jgi:exodeoxyribonuclease VII large subunit